MGRRPLRFVDDAMSSLLTRAAHSISLPFLQAAKKQGLNATEWRILATLSDGDGLTIGQLANTVMAKQPTVSKIIDRMTQAGWVQRLPGTSDKRHTMLHTTEHGRKLVQHLLRQHHDREVSALEALSDQDLVQLKALLKRLIENTTSKN